MICSASNERQLGTIIEEVIAQLKTDGDAPRRREGEKESGWVLVDYGDIVVHAFTDEQRAYYDLERLWSDAPAMSYDDEPDRPTVASTTASAASTA